MSLYKIKHYYDCFRFPTHIKCCHPIILEIPGAPGRNEK